MTSRKRPGDATRAGRRASKGVRFPKRLRRRWVVFALLAAALSGGSLWWCKRYFDDSLVEPPVIDPQVLEPAVAEAIMGAREDVLRSPRSASAWGRMGMLLFAHQFGPETHVCFEQAGRLDPEEFRWPYLLALSVFDTDRQAGIGHFQRALRLRPDVGVAHNRLGELLLEAQEYEQAGVHLATAVRLQPDEVRPQVAMARLAYRRGAPREALQWAERAARLAPGERTPHELLAAIHHQLDNREAALAALAIAESLPDEPLTWHDPFAAEVMQLRRDTAWRLDQAEALLAEGRTAEAIRLLEETMRAGDRSPRLPCALARALIQAGRLDQAAEVLERAAGLYPEAPEVRFQRGVAHFFSGEYDKAAALFRQAIHLKPDYALAHYNLGHATERLGDRAAALGAFESAARFRPAHPDAHTNAGRILMELGKPVEALERLRAAVRLAPNDDAARRLLEKASAAGASTGTCPPRDSPLETNRDG